MVALAVPRFGFVVEPNLARPFLYRAYDALQAGNLLEAGVLLREAVRRQLYAECSWKGCLPEGASERTPPRCLLAALRKAGFVDECGYQIARSIIATGNAAAHCRRVNVHDLRGCIALWHGSIDNDPCGEPRERVEHCLPAVNDYLGDDDDDDDGSDWWKAGAA